MNVDNESPDNNTVLVCLYADTQNACSLVELSGGEAWLDRAASAHHREGLPHHERADLLVQL